MDDGAMLTCVLFDAAGRDRQIDPAEIGLEGLESEQLLWIDGTPAEAAAARLPAPMRHALASRDKLGDIAVNERFYQFVVPHPSGHAVADSDRIAFFVGDNWLLTLSEPRPDFMDRFLNADDGETLKGRMSSSALVAALLLDLLSKYRTELVNVDKSVDKLDETILRARERRAPLKTLAVLRRRVAHVRLTLSELAGVIHALNRPDFLTHVEAGDAAYFGQLRHTFDHLEDMAARVREAIVNSFDLYDTRVSQDTNQLIKALTIVTVVTGIVGAVAGVFGMNFDIPLSHMGLRGFWLVIDGMAASSLSVLALAIWRRWI
jgi:Mg2+ and Co2+ transporter CorA